MVGDVAATASSPTIVPPPEHRSPLLLRSHQRLLRPRSRHLHHPHRPRSHPSRVLRRMTLGATGILRSCSRHLRPRRRHHHGGTIRTSGNSGRSRSGMIGTSRTAIGSGLPSTVVGPGSAHHQPLLHRLRSRRRLRPPHRLRPLSTRAQHNGSRFIFV